MRKIIAAADITENDIIVEIGPGKGVLTAALAQSAKQVIAIEVDRDMLPFLDALKEKHRDITIVRQDARTAIPELFETNGALAKEPRYRVIANIPYNLTSLLIRLFLEGVPRQPTDMILLIQKEVGERLCAKPGDMSLLAVSAQYFATTKILFTVSRGSFSPPPKVQSAVVHLRIRPPQERLNPEEERNFFRLVHAGFRAKRKTLARNCADTFNIPVETIKALLIKSNLPEKVRAEELFLEQWRGLLASMRGII